MVPNLRCAKCSFDNPGGMKFCGQCTAPLAQVCPKCGFENPLGFKFCGQCTTALGPGSTKLHQGRDTQAEACAHFREVEPAAALDGERKTVTALFADIKGSMAPLEPEAVRAMLVDLLGNDASIEGLVKSIYARTAGNPFFTEEAVQSLIESGALEGTRGSYRLVKPIEQLQVPPTVLALLAARIDRLGEREKFVLQSAAGAGPRAAADWRYWRTGVAAGGA